MSRKSEKNSAAQGDNAPTDQSNVLPVDNNDPTSDVGETPNTDLFESTVDAHSVGYEGFDPDIHAMDSSGKPKTNKDGSFAKKRGRKTGASNPLPQPGAVNDEQTKGTVPLVTRALAEEAAKGTANTIFAITTMGISMEWVPRPGEAQAIAAGFTDYYMARGIPKIPPEIALIATLVMYAAPRLGLPETQAKIRKIKGILSGRARQEKAQSEAVTKMNNESAS